MKPSREAIPKGVSKQNRTTFGMALEENIIPINIEDEMRGAYIDYSMSVIVSRALPDVRDGLKPVHRRILYGMSDLGLVHNRPYKKSARIVGEVLGKYHPHGDTAVYDAMVRMAQPWSLRYMLVDGQGNFGSIDGDSPAAMRYTEARLKEAAGEMLADIKKDTVDFTPNFDDSLEEPSVMPGKLPNLLVNGTSGIAVGMATNMPPHNLSEVVDGIVAYIDNPAIEIRELMEHVKGPDFPTGGIVYGMDGVVKALETGRGRVVIRSVTHFEQTKTGRDMIVVTEIPYMVNKALMIEKTAALVNEKKIEGISEIRDESDRQGIRVVYELKRDAIPDIVLNNLFKYTSLQSTFSVNNVALVKGRPQILNLKDLIRHFVDHRHEIVVRRTRYDLADAEKRAHILEGLLKALDHLDEVIELIRASKDPDVARAGLMERFGFSEPQAVAILNMRLQRLTGLEREKLQAEYDELLRQIEYFRNVLADEGMRMGIIKDELLGLKEKYGDARRSQLVLSADDLEIEDMIPNEEMLITISNAGYIKRTPLKEYRTQNRGGVGSRGVTTKDDDFTEHLFIATSHNYLLFFTKFGKLYWLKAYKIPEGSKTSKGRPLQNLIQIDKDDKVQAVINVPTLTDEDFVQHHYLIMATEKGVIKKTALEAYSRPRQNGINAININEGDRLLDVKLTDGNCYIILAVRSGRAIRFHEETVRPMGRVSTGVRGISLDGDHDSVVGLVCVSEQGDNLLVVSEQGYGKRSEIDDYRITNRGGKGVKTLNITEKTGELISIKNVTDADELMIITKAGIAIRMEIAALRVMGRATQGVRLMRLNDGDEISSVAKIERLADDEVAPIDDISTETTTNNDSEE
jgi:DNA gyrase subunit A